MLGHVGDVHGRFHRQEEQGLQHRALFGIEIDGARGPRLVQRRADFFQRGNQAPRLLVPTCFRGLGVLGKLLVDSGQVRQRQLGVDRLDIGYCVDLAGDVNDVVVLEAANHVRNRVSLANGRQELIAEALPLRCAGDQSGDVHEFNRSGKNTLGTRYRGQGRKTRIGHFDDTDVGLDGAKRIVLGRDPGFGQRVEER